VEGSARRTSSSPWRWTAGNFQWLRDEVEHLFVHRLAVAGDEQEVERSAVWLADEKHGRDAAADAANRAGAVRGQLSGGSTHFVESELGVAARFCGVSIVPGMMQFMLMSEPFSS